MSKQEKRLNRWRENIPKETRVEEVISVINAYIGKANWKWGSKGSHMTAKHEKLKGLKDYGQEGEFGIAVKSGQKVKGHYIKELIKAIDIIKEDIEESE